MVSLADSLVASSSRPLGLRKRADLTARKQTYQGRSYWVVKEPVGLRYFRFQEEEFAVLNMLTGLASLEDVKKEFESEFAPHKITYQDLQQFIGTLHRSGLVVSDAIGQGRQLKKRGDERSRKELLGKLTNVLALRFKGIDPEWLLNAMYPYTRWMFTRTVLCLAILLGISALLLIGVQFDVFRSRLPGFESFFGPKNWGYLALTLAVTKIIHEFGHGLLCKHFGGECHEMGVMFLVLTPCLYCNVSDSWMLPNKWHRAAIGAGGIYFELVMASVATFVWWFTEPGMFNHLALRVMFICSISTVLFNGNPLLRFDGYYILSDILEIPNLRQKATKVLQRYAAEWCLGIEMPEDPFLPERNQAMFALYTLAAVAYRWFVFLSILFFLNKVFEPYGLKIIGRFLAMMGLFGLIIQPLWRMGKFFHVPGRMDQMKWPRLYATIAIFATVVLGILLIPLPRNVKCAFQIQLANSENVYVDAPGNLDEIFVAPGQEVAAGQPLAKLRNSQLTLTVTGLEKELAEYEAELDSLRKRRFEEPQVIGQIKQVEALIQAKSDELNQRLADLETLTLTAPMAGTVFSPPLRKEEEQSEHRLVSWGGSPFDPKNQGMFLEPKEVFCVIGNRQKMEAILAIDQEDADFVFEGQSVNMILDALTDDRLEGTVETISKRDMQVAPTSLSNQAGGELATRKDASGIERPLSTTFQATVPLEVSGNVVRVGFRGRAKIRVDYQTLGSRLWQYLTRTFHFYV